MNVSKSGSGSAGEGPPLHGTKTHPLSAHAKAELHTMARHGAVPRQEVNPGVADRLLREALVESVQLPSPFKTHKGRMIEHLQITDSGRTLLAHGENSDG